MNAENIRMDTDTATPPTAKTCIIKEVGLLLL